MNPGNIPWPLLVPLLILGWLFAVPLAVVAGLVCWVRWLRRPAAVKEAERRSRRRARTKTAQKIETLVQLQLIAHRLPDTPHNRARVLQALYEDAR